MPLKGDINTMIAGLPNLSSDITPLEEELHHWPLCHSPRDKDLPPVVPFAAWEKTLDTIIGEGRLSCPVDRHEPVSGWKDHYVFFYKAPRIRRIKRDKELSLGGLLCGACLFLLDCEGDSRLASVGEATPFDTGCLDDTKFGLSSPHEVENKVAQASLSVREYLEHVA